MKKIYPHLLLAFLTPPTLMRAQSATDSVPYCCDFENTVERVYWRYANQNANNANKWTIGYGTQNGNGLYGMYITNDGTSHNYSNVQSYSYAYRKIHIPTGIYEVSYDWKANGYSSITYAYLRVFLIPATATLSGGALYNGLSGTSLPAGRQQRLAAPKPVDSFQRPAGAGAANQRLLPRFFLVQQHLRINIVPASGSNRQYLHYPCNMPQTTGHHQN